MKYNIVSGISQQFYHSIPSDLDLIQTTPTREAIFQILSQIPFSKFPEFVADILVRIHNHTLEDVTDGQGDEKQDILTITPGGNRCLTQCKHTINYKIHHNGDELDVMMGACLRKDCLEAHYVTNSDLTPQGKKYINDKEYQRGWKADPALCPQIDYWNGHDIWDKIKNDAVIMNKWFSGLGQVTGLRSFKFDLTIQKLPYEGDVDDSGITGLMSIIKTKKWANELQADMAYAVDFKNKFTANIKRWFQFSGNLDINFVLPNDDVDFLHKPLYALTIEVIVSDKQEVYSYSHLRNEVISFISAEVLNDLGKDAWWHVTCGQIKSNVFLHDINEPREIIIESAFTFVKYQNNQVESEIQYCTLNSKNFKLNTSDGDTDTIWTHRESGIQIIELFEQKINPIADFQHQVQNYHKHDELKQYIFHAVSNIDSMMMMRVRQQLPMEWIAMEKNKTDFLWGFPNDTTEGVIKNTHKKIEAIGLKVLKVKDEDVSEMIDALKVYITPRFHIHSDFKNLSFPISLEQRIFWLSHEVEFELPFDFDHYTALLVHKYKFENEHGFNNMGDKEQVQYKEHEIKGLLFNIMTFRSTRMMDIGFTSEKTMSLNIRFSEHRIDSANSLAEYYVKEFKKIQKEIVKLIMNIK